MLINKSLETGKVPSSFKLAKVIPILIQVKRERQYE